ncbi:MAG TPA: glycine zipper 2TM domain-containing protein [Sphingomonas sp.]|nr:glycine zipper 2TM domain-containing protein [Sphingomonas sp.]
MRALVLGLMAAATLAGCTDYGYGAYGSGSGYSGYDWNRPDPSYGGYYADRYYREDRRYGERRLSRNDRIYRGQDGRYYCRRSDGTTGLIVGGVAGGVLGNIIAPGGSETLGTVLGAVAGAVAGTAIEREADRKEQNIRCR